MFLINTHLDESGKEVSLNMKNYVSIPKLAHDIIN